MNVKLIKVLFGAGNTKSEKLISDNYRFIWAGIPKSATTSIMEALHRGTEANYGTIEVADKLSKLLQQNPKYNNYFKFAFVRNPWSRVVSCYENKVVNSDIKGVDFIKYYPGLKPNISFLDFVYFLARGWGRNDFFSDRHWLSQHKFISDNTGKILVDFVGRIENIDFDFAQACSAIGLPRIKLPKLNTQYDWELNKKNIKDRDAGYYRKYFNNETRELIKQRYIKDIKMFNYIF